ncbi:MAG: PEGA domain-containing protein [Polyangiaceae bacterium]
MSSRFHFLLVIAVASSSASALADPVPVSTPSAGTATTEARERFKRGVVLYREGSFDAAFAEFRRAYELSPNYRVLYNLAQVQVERHDSVAAIDAFAQYLQQGGSEIEPERRAQVERDMATLRSRVAELTITSNVSGVRVSIDGVESGTLPLAAPLLVNSGVRQLLLEKLGYRSVSRTQAIAGAQPLQLSLNLEKLTEGATDGQRAGTGEASGMPGAPAAPHARAHSLSTPFWVSAIATGLFAGGAVTFGILATNRNQKLDDQLNQFPADPRATSDARSSLKTEAALTDVFTGAALVAGAATVYFALTSNSAREAPKQNAALPARVKLTTNGSALILSGKF